MKKAILLTVVFFWVWVISVSAREVELEKIVITPYRTEILSKVAGATVEEIDVEETQNKGIYSLKEALAESTSIMKTATGIGGDTSIFLRGHNSYHSRFMLDGIKIYDPILTSGYYNFAHFKLIGVDRIEVSKGPQSSLYGSDAIGGIINLLSKKGKEKPKFIYQQKIGSYHTYEESLEFNGRKDNFGYNVGVIRTDTGGYSLAKEKNNNHERDSYHNLNAILNLDYEISDRTKLELIGHYIYAKYEYDGSSWTPPYLPVDDDDNYAYDYEGILGLKVKYSISNNLDYKLTLASTKIYRKGWEDALTDYWYLGSTYQLDNQFELRPVDFYKIIFGFDYLREKGDSFRADSWGGSDFPKETANNKGYFLENILEPNKNILFSLSYRLDDHSSFKDKSTYRIGGSYLFNEDTKLKASFGTGFKAPSLYQLYAPQTAWGPIGNSNLKPEKSETYEIGFEHKFNDNLKLSSVYFHSQLKDLIDYIGGQGYVNVSKSRIKGIENELIYSLNKNIDLSLGYTWLDTENKENHAELARRPSNKVLFRIKGEFDKLTTYLDISYTGHRFSDTSGNQLLKPYVLGNIAINYKLKDNFEVFSRVENIVDEKYEEIKGYQTSKFSLFFGTRLIF
ncbi:MAG: TonB-dependent receptor [Candidatus Omnitrophica bacterium]|nr:TonB-dependent receptor [Candidatus Omnitrophota bacterium]